jgi:hypothetical protein
MNLWIKKNDKMKCRFLLLNLLLSNILFPCTMFVATDNDLILVGNNEDGFNPNAQVQFYPGTNGNYDRIYFSYDDGFPQGGMNDQGLVFDGFATKYFPLKEQGGKPIFKEYLAKLAMRKCSTVDEVIDLYKRYNLQSQRMEYYQLMFADRQGNSVIIEGDRIHHNRLGNQVVTNFYLSTLKKNKPIPCSRYKTTLTMLKKHKASVETFEKILNAVSQNQRSGRTIYSNIYDLKKGIIYIYYFGDFSHPVTIHLQEEIKKGHRVVDFSHYFQSTPGVKAFNKAYQTRIHRFRLPGIGLLISRFVFILALVLILFVLLVPHFKGIAEKLKVNQWKDTTPCFLWIWLISHATIGILGTGFLFMDITFTEMWLKLGLEIPSSLKYNLISWGMLMFTVGTTFLIIKARKKNELCLSLRIFLIILIINSLYLITHQITWGFFHLV